MKHGRGRLTLGDGTYYEGDFTCGEMTGAGYRVWADGRSYSGGFLEGEMHGVGTLLSPDGSRFEGNFRHGKKNGARVLTTHLWSTCMRACMPAARFRPRWWQCVRS